MKEVFISYESSNQKQAENLVEALEEKRYDCWIAIRDVPKGEPYDDYIPEAIAECKIVVMLFSRASLASPHVKKELRIAVKHGKKIIPFMLEDVELTAAFEYHIESNNRISADKNWNKAVEELLQSMNHEKADASKADKRSEPKERLVHHVHSGYICCPRCGATSLKQKRYYVDNYFKYRTDKTPEPDFMLWVRKNRPKIEMTLAIVAIVLVAIALTWLFIAPEDGFTTFVVSASGLVLGLFLVLYFILNISCDSIEDDLILTIQQSNLKYWTFRCGVCEIDFSVLVPKEDTLEQRVEHLLNKKQAKKS